MRVCVSVQMSKLLTRVCSCHFEVMPCSPEISGVRPCGGDVNGSDDNYEVGVKVR